MERWRNVGYAALTLLSGAVLALAWWDLLYPGVVPAWWADGRLYAFFRHRLLWVLFPVEILLLGLRLLSLAKGRQRGTRARWKILSCVLPLLGGLFFLRYFIHPWGIEVGSSAWAFGLAAVTAAVLASIGAPLWLALGKGCARARWAWVVAGVLCGVYVLVFGLLSVARHTSFRSHALDLGTMDQAAWNTAQGRILERTPLYRAPAAGSRYENRLLDAKLELMMFPLSALYWIWADPRLLLVAQTMALAGGGMLLFGLARRDLELLALPSLLLTLSYLIYLPLHYVNMADFHPSALMIPCLIAAWRAAVRRRWAQYYVWLILALCCRIDAAFVTLALGLALMLIRRRSLRHGLYTTGIGALWLVVNMAVVVPAVRVAYPGAGDLVLRRFGALGERPLDMLRTLVVRPALVGAALLRRDNVQTLFDLLGPLGFLSAFSPLALIPAAPVLAINMLAQSSWQSTIHAHYMAPVLPFVWIAGINGVAWLDRRIARIDAATLGVFVLANTALVSWIFSPFPPGRSFSVYDFYQPSVYERNLRQVVALVPDDATVCAQSDLHPHLSQRRDAALFPLCQFDENEQATYVVLDLDPTSVKSPLGYHAFYEQVGAWLGGDDYGIVAQRGGALLFERGASRENMDQVLAALDAYGRGLYQAVFAADPPQEPLRTGDYYRLPVVVQNSGTQCWHSRGQLPVRLSYRWFDSEGQVLYDVPSLRSDLPHRLAPGYETTVQGAVVTPPLPGRYTLEWDLLREGDAWFGDMGGTTLRWEVRVE